MLRVFFIDKKGESILLDLPPSNSYQDYHMGILIGNHHLLLESWVGCVSILRGVDPYRKAFCRCIWCIVESQVSEQKSWNEVSKRSEGQ